MTERSLNRIYSSRSMRWRYEVWFLRFQLANGRGAWWFRYLLMNLGRPGGGGCPGHRQGLPVQVWATWFPRQGRPQSYIQGFRQEELSMSDRGTSPFYLKVGENRIDEESCRGRLSVDGHRLTWELHYRSTVHTTMTEVGWIGFSRTPHTDATFSGTVTLDGHTFTGDPLGFGLQGHNCGFRHRHLWNWTHCLFADEPGGPMSTFEALEYEMPLGLRFRKALLWHRGTLYTFRRLRTIVRDRHHLQWAFTGLHKDGSVLTAVIDGSGPSIHRLPYLKTNCSSTFEVANNSLARATLYFRRPGQPVEQLTTDGGAVLEMAGD